MNNIELIYASDVEEFFYEDSNEPVQEGDPVGIEWDELENMNFPKRDLIVNFDLLNNIYWNPEHEQ